MPVYKSKYIYIYIFIDMYVCVFNTYSLNMVTSNGSCGAGPGIGSMSSPVATFC